ncbi:DUF58 domain-containing protein [Nocardioides oleivorans]|uniref:DUF58 domain-containing protein n=1 Tax=Nocardioides oleivorans TaxID=273676 RepID=A0A4Q2RVI2_9ACTN|nr:DUF58 domain-containing protein [Nocardioides oleivorans]RYB91915.1 DUF58 domain-containing protein [Nocardioides oleivorans]
MSQPTTPAATPGWRTRAMLPWRALTPLGRSVLVLGLAVTGVSWWLHWQEFTQLGVVALGLVLVGLTWQALPGAPEVELTLRPHRVVEGGAPPTLTLRVQAGAAAMLSPRLAVQVGRHSVRLRLPFLLPFAHRTEEVRLPDLPRGVHRVGPTVYEKTDPLGLVVGQHPVGGGLELMVAPRVTDLSVFAGGLTNDLDGATSQQLSMSDLAFHALREYAPGDDLRHVHWRSSAKAGELLVRQYLETRRGHVTILVDGCAGSYARLRDFELAVSVASSIALRAVRDDFDTYLRCGARTASGRSAEAMIDVACRFEVHRDDDHLQQAADAASAVGGTGLVVQVTGARRDVVQLDAAARSFGQGPDWMVVRAETEGRATLTDSPRVRELTVQQLSDLRDLMARGLR